MDEVVVFVVVVVFTGIKHTHKICGLATLCLNVNILIIGHRYASIFYCRKYRYVSLFSYVGNAYE